MTNSAVPLRSSVRPWGRTLGSIPQRLLIAVLVVGTISSTGCITLIATLLSKHGKKIDVVNPEEVDRVVSDVGFNDVTRIGTRLKADYVIEVGIRDLKLKEGPTLYRGVCDCSLSVYKVADGDQVVFAKEFPQFAYPMTGGVHVTETNDATFRGMYLSVLANRVARNFYSYDPTTDVGLDAAASSLSRN